jgi:hypothetical protein
MLQLLAARTMRSNSRARLRLIEPVSLQATRWRCPQAASFDSFSLEPKVGATRRRRVLLSTPCVRFCLHCHAEAGPAPASRTLS